MTNWITQFNDVEDADTHLSGGTAYVANNMVADFASSIGFKKLHYKNFLNLENAELRCKELAEGMLSAVQSDDVVVVQFPLWTNKTFDLAFFEELEKKKCKKIAFIHDIQSYMGNYNKDTDHFLNLLRRFDIIIAHNQKMIAKLQGDDVNVPMISMHLFDFPAKSPISPRKFEKKIFWIGMGIGMPHVSLDSYRGKTPWYIYTAAKKISHGDNVKIHDLVPAEELTHILDGGFGLLELQPIRWVDYGAINNPFKLSQYISLGLPVIVSSRIAHAEWIKEQKIGFVVDDFNEIDAIVDNMTEEDYNEILENIKPWQKAVHSGYFAKHALFEALKLTKG
ncbi:MAG: hypothetical protein FWE43_03235 [Streptococcaceae bacterium]|nr:hypothetical protein [Streptococcaceae bacterium]MCL2681477.1 hypothetical protein [Streptococcaceae bacterium]